MHSGVRQFPLASLAVVMLSELSWHKLSLLEGPPPAPSSSPSKPQECATTLCD
jgi:hypothetical protein